MYEEVRGAEGLVVPVSDPGWTGLGGWEARLVDRGIREIDINSLVLLPQCKMNKNKAEYPEG